MHIFLSKNAFEIIIYKMAAILSRCKFVELVCSGTLNPGCMEFTGPRYTNAGRQSEVWNEHDILWRIRATLTAQEKTDQLTKIYI